MLGSERVSGIRQQDMAWARQGQAATIRPEPGLKANITEPSCHGQPGERGSRPAPADSGSECDHCESCVQSPAPESHTGPRARAEPEPVPEPEPWHHNRSPSSSHSNIQTSERRGTMGALENVTLDCEFRNN